MTILPAKVTGLLTLFLIAAAEALLAQDAVRPGTLANQSLRPYWHVFIAYAIAIVFVIGWVISIGRRLRDVEEHLGD